MSIPDDDLPALEQWREILPDTAPMAVILDRILLPADPDD